MICMFPTGVTQRTRYTLQELTKYMTELQICVYSFVRHPSSSKALACLMVAIGCLDVDCELNAESKVVFVSSYMIADHIALHYHTNCAPFYYCFCSPSLKECVLSLGRLRTIKTLRHWQKNWGSSSTTILIWKVSKQWNREECDLSFHLSVDFIFTNLSPILIARIHCSHTCKQRLWSRHRVAEEFCRQDVVSLAKEHLGTLEYGESVVGYMI